WVPASAGTTNHGYITQIYVNKNLCRIMRLMPGALDRQDRHNLTLTDSDSPERRMFRQDDEHGFDHLMRVYVYNAGEVAGWRSS
ncbi:MAG: hypothetical protein JXX14_06865, partial [Deltaproteobacteria bacterium]|nr:hypothetical protein [Deltaproteobacteria bacterium]